MAAHQKAEAASTSSDEFARAELAAISIHHERTIEADTNRTKAAMLSSRDSVLIRLSAHWAPAQAEKKATSHGEIEYVAAAAVRNPPDLMMIVVVSAIAVE